MQIFVNTDKTDSANGVKDKFMNLGQGYMGVLELFQIYCKFEIMLQTNFEKVANKHTMKSEHMMIFLYSYFPYFFYERIFS